MICRFPRDGEGMATIFLKSLTPSRYFWSATRLIEEAFVFHSAADAWEQADRLSAEAADWEEGPNWMAFKVERPTDGYGNRYTIAERPPAALDVSHVYIPNEHS